MVASVNSQVAMYSSLSYYGATLNCQGQGACKLRDIMHVIKSTKHKQ